MEITKYDIVTATLYTLTESIVYCGDYPHELKCLLNKSLNIDVLTCPKVQQIVQRASNCLCKDPKLEESSLTNVFHDVRLKRSLPPVSIYPLKPMELGVAYPKKNMGGFSAGVLVTTITQSLKELLDLNLKPRNMASHWLLVLERYAWSLSVGNNMSAADFIRTTAAIAECMFINREKNKEQYTVVVGEFGGIQRYIYQISGVGVGGVARRLRGRSFYVNAMIEGVAHAVLHKFGLSQSNIIMSSGGKFYILAQDYSLIESAFGSLKEQLEKELLESYRGEITLSLAMKSFDEDKFMSFDRVLNEVNKELLLSKNKAFQHVLIDENGWSEDAFIQPLEKGEMLCLSCRIIPTQGDVCSKCSIDYEIGKQIPKTEYLAFCKEVEQGSVPLLNGYSVKLMSSADKEPNSTYAVAIVNSWEVPSMHLTAPYIKLLATYNPINDTNIATFDDIAQQAEGKHYLGFLKGDVDDLGNIFANGLSGETATVNIVKCASLSRFLDIFFSGEIQRLASEKYPWSYIVYSGGDDFLIVAPWDKLLNLAEDIHKSFEEFTGFNPNFGLSAGIFLSRPALPVFRAAEKADEALMVAKNELDLMVCQRKGHVSIFGDNIAWQYLNPVKKDAKALIKLVENKAIGRSFVQALLNYDAMYRQYRRGVNSARVFPLLAYNISRQIDSAGRHKRDVKSWFKGLLNRKHNRKLCHLRFLASYALLRTK